MRSKRFQLPPLELLPSFEAAARHLSFTKAADELALTQSAVSRQIHALEVALGGPLFERRTRALLLTERGRSLLNCAQDVLGQLDRTTRTLRGARDLHGVTLTTTPGFASLWLIPRLARFTGAHPEVDVRTSATNRVIDIERDGVDVAIRFCTQQLGRGGTRLFGGQVTPVCSPRLVAASKHPLAAPADLRHFALLYLDEPQAAWFDWDLWFHALGLDDFRPQRRLHFSQYDQMIQAAMSGQGMALGLELLVRELLHEGKLIAPFRKTPMPARAWYLLRSSASAGRVEVDAFVAWLTAEIKSARKGSARARAQERGAR